MQICTYLQNVLSKAATKHFKLSCRIKVSGKIGVEVAVSEVFRLKVEESTIVEW